MGFAGGLVNVRAVPHRGPGGKAGRAAEAIPVLEQKLRNGRMDLPPPG